MTEICALSIQIYALLGGSFTFTLTAFGAFFIFFFHGTDGKITGLVNAFSAGIMLSASFFSLLLPACECETSLPAFLPVTVGFLLAPLTYAVFDALMKRRRKGAFKSTLLYTAVTLHNIPEGMAIGVAFAGGGVLQAMLLTLGIGVQNIPEGLCVALPLRANGLGRRKSFVLSAVSGFVEIPSAVLGALATEYIRGLMPWSLSFAGGAMIAVACAELLPEGFLKRKYATLFAFSIGFALMAFLDLALG